MNGQRYQKEEEKSVVPSTNAVIHLVPRNEKQQAHKKGETKRETNRQIIRTIRKTNTHSADIRNKLIKELKN